MFTYLVFPAYNYPVVNPWKSIHLSPYLRSPAMLRQAQPAQFRIHLQTAGQLASSPARFDSAGRPGKGLRWTVHASGLACSDRGFNFCPLPGDKAAGALVEHTNSAGEIQSSLEYSISKIIISVNNGTNAVANIIFIYQPFDCRSDQLVLKIGLVNDRSIFSTTQDFEQPRMLFQQYFPCVVQTRLPLSLIHI